MSPPILGSDSTLYHNSTDCIQSITITITITIIELQLRVYYYLQFNPRVSKCYQNSTTCQTLPNYLQQYQQQQQQIVDIIDSRHGRQCCYIQKGNKIYIWFTKLLFIYPLLIAQSHMYVYVNPVDSFTTGQVRQTPQLSGCDHDTLRQDQQ